MASNNYAVLVCSSDYWFNYRHMNSVLSMYNFLLRNGFLNSNIIVMNTLDILCSPRNPIEGCLPETTSSDSNLFSENTYIDYKGGDVTIQNFIDVLLGTSDITPMSRSLPLNKESNLLIFMSGHGGDEFFKFRDYEELNTADFVSLFDQMFERKRYKEILFIVDTCQAETLGATISAPNITFVGSSHRGENSYGYQWSEQLHAGLNDRFSFQLMEYLRTNLDISGITRKHQKRAALKDLLGYFNPHFLHSNVYVKSTRTYASHLDLYLMDFFTASFVISPQVASTLTFHSNKTTGSLYCEKPPSSVEDPSRGRFLLTVPTPMTDDREGSVYGTWQWQNDRNVLLLLIAALYAVFVYHRGGL